MCVCVSLSVIRCNNNSLHIQSVGTKDPTKKGRKQFIFSTRYIQCTWNVKTRLFKMTIANLS